MMTRSVAPQALGYIGIRAKALDDWAGYGAGLLGLQRLDQSRSTLAFRMDDRKQRIVVHADGGEGIGFFGWEVADAKALDALAAHLDNSGINVAHCSRDLADERHVADLIVISDPVGNRLEFFTARKRRRSRSGLDVVFPAFAPVRLVWDTSCSTLTRRIRSSA
jgi:hypothetical protein